MPDTLHVAMTGETDLTFTRRFDASPALVWRAITEPALILRWLWSAEAPMTVCEQDFREGGAFRWGWRRPSGDAMIVNGRFVTIAPPHRLVHTELFEEDWTGGETRVTTELAEIAPQTTRMTMVVRYSSAEARQGAVASAMTEGMDEAYRRLDGLLPEVLAGAQRSDFRLVAEGADRIVVTRSFAAPPDRVQRAFLDPAILPRWMGSAAFPLAECHVDARAGGGFRYAWTTPDGTPLVLTGTFDAVEPARIVHRERFEPDWTGGETRVVTEFLALDGGERTLVRTTIVYSGTAARDAVAASGMGEGMAASFDALDTVLG